MKFFKFAAGTITSIIALWIGMLVLKFLFWLFGALLALLATLFGIAVVVIKVIFVLLLIGLALGLAYLAYSVFLKPKRTERTP